MPITKNHLASLGIAAFMACAIPAIAQDVRNLIDQQAEINPSLEEFNELERTNQFRIGLDCAPSDPALKSHLRLDGDTGLTVNMVLPNSPAAIAGILQYDVVVEANGHAVGQVIDLVRQVNDAGENEMSVTLIREGEEHLVKVTPEKRDENEMQRLRTGFRNQLGQAMPGFETMGPEIQELFKQFPQMNQMGNGAFRRINPGFAIPALPDIPNDFNIRIERNNDKITVQQGNDRYEVTIDTLDQLPDDIRPMVENMLNRGRFSLHGLFAPGTGNQPRWPALPQPPIPPQPNKRLEDRFDGLELQLQQLQETIRKFEDKDE